MRIGGISHHTYLAHSLDCQLGSSRSLGAVRCVYPRAWISWTLVGTTRNIVETGDLRSAAKLRANRAHAHVMARLDAFREHTGAHQIEVVVVVVVGTPPLFRKYCFTLNSPNQKKLQNDQPTTQPTVRCT